MALQRMEEGIAAHYIAPLYLISVPNIQDEVGNLRITAAGPEGFSD